MSIRHKFFKPEIQDDSASVTEWNDLTNLQQLGAIIEESDQTPIVIFKHSTRCDLSSSMLKSFERRYNFADSIPKPYFLDLIAYRAVSDAIALRFGIKHESPQVIFIKERRCQLQSNHSDIVIIDMELLRS